MNIFAYVIKLENGEYVSKVLQQSDYEIDIIPTNNIIHAEFFEKCNEAEKLMKEINSGKSEDERFDIYSDYKTEKVIKIELKIKLI